MIEPGVRDVDVAEAWSDVAIADLPDVDRRPGSRTHSIREVLSNLRPRLESNSKDPSECGDSRFRELLRRLWIPLLIAVVIGGGGLTVARLHGIFGSEKRPTYADSQIGDTKPFDPKHLTYEIFGPPGTVGENQLFRCQCRPEAG